MVSLWRDALGGEGWKYLIAKVLPRGVRVVHVLAAEHLGRLSVLLCRVLLTVAPHVTRVSHTRTSVLRVVTHASVLHLSEIWWRHGLLLRLCLLLNRSCLCLTCCLPARSVRSLGSSMAPRVFSRHDINEKVEHVALCERCGNVTTLQGAALVVFGMNPGTHGQFGDEDVAAFGEEDWGFGGDHLDFGVGFHHFLDAGERELVNFEVMGFCLEVIDGLLPVSSEDVAGGAGQALIDLDNQRVLLVSRAIHSHLTIGRSRVQCVGHTLGRRAVQRHCQRVVLQLWEQFLGCSTRAPRPSEDRSAREVECQP
jgi:hypothetical protein